DRAFIGLRPAVAEQYPIRKGLLAQQRRQFGMRRSVIQVADVQDAVAQRLLYGRSDVRVAVAERVDRDTGHKIEISVAFSVVQRYPSPSGQHKWRASVTLHNIRLLKINNLLGQIHSCHASASVYAEIDTAVNTVPLCERSPARLVMTAWGTPRANTDRAVSTFGIIPPKIVPSAIS